MKHRSERLGDEVRMELGRIVSRMADPRVGFATVTEVQMSPDMRYARVFVSVLGDDAAQKKSIEALESAKSYLRHELAGQVALRYIPELVFTLDRGFEQTARVEELLRRARKRRPKGIPKPPRQEGP